MPTLSAPSVAASTSSFTYIYGSGSTITVDGGITVTQPDNSFPLDGIYAMIVTGFTNGDVLSIKGATAVLSGTNTTYTGGPVPANVSAVFNATNGVLKCVIDGIASDTYKAPTWQALMRAVQFSTTAVASGNTSRGFSFTLGEKQALTVTSSDETGATVAKPHYYEFVPKLHTSWNAARAEAKTKTFFGLRGYLACITSAAENNFILNKIRQPNGSIPRGWIGATDLANPDVLVTAAGTYRWIDGPEAGNTLAYANYSAGEPNNVIQANISPQGEHYLHFMPSGQWNDLPGSGPVVDGNNNLSPNTNIWSNTTWANTVVPNYSLLGYVVEYGGFSDDPALTINTSVTINLTSVENAVVAEDQDIATLQTQVASLKLVTAPKGAKGDIGPTGLKGATGDDGIKGLTGDTGPTGAQGPTGPTGADGIQGIDGSGGITGLDGAVGPIGEDGNQGESGDEGSIGLTGDTGPQGPKGPKGLVGDAGAEGAKGAIGNTGSTGRIGNQGIVGLTGDPGDDGAKGAPGDPGAVGAKGDSGAIGIIGIDGEQGPAGIEGLVGNTGPTGPVGPAGLAGEKGNAGDPGDQGAQGPIGLVGETGATGAVGPQGPVGPVGARGEDADTFSGLVRVAALEREIITKEQASRHIDQLLTNGISPLAVTALKNALDDTYVTTEEIGVATNLLDAQIGRLNARVDHLVSQLQSKTLCVVRKVTFAS